MINKNDLIEKAKMLDTTAISDTRKGTTRVLDPAIVCRSANAKMFGFAHTVKTENDILAVFAALSHLDQDDVLVVDGGSLAIAYGGELFARDISAHGAAGIIVDGGYRDIGYISNMDFPVYSRFAVPNAGPHEAAGQEQVEIKCGGINIKPGDFIIGDENGVIVLDPEEADSILDDAIKVKDKEAKIIEGFAAGKRLADMTNVDDYQIAVKNGDNKAEFVWKV